MTLSAGRWLPYLTRPRRFEIEQLRAFVSLSASSHKRFMICHTRAYLPKPAVACIPALIFGQKLYRVNDLAYTWLINLPALVVTNMTPSESYIAMTTVGVSEVLNGYIDGMYSILRVLFFVLTVKLLR